MKPPTRMDMPELRTELLTRQYAPEQLDGLSRTQLIELVRACRQSERSVKQKATPQATNGPAPESTETPAAKVLPRPTDPEWSGHVLSMFLDEEMEGTNPKVDGLRRVAEKLVGTIIQEGCELVSAPTVENLNRACVKAWVVFASSGREKRFEALADVYEGNCDPAFARFPTSVAESRAKGRCLRAALRLRRVIAAEEGCTSVPLAGDGGGEAINSGQVSVIQVMADRLKVSIPQMLQHLEIGKTDLKALTSTEGLLVVRNLNTLQETGHVPSTLLRV